MVFIIRRIVLDVLKPHVPPIHEFAKKLGEIPHIKKVDITIQEIDEDTQTVRISIEGNELLYEEIEKKISELGATIHSVDEATGVRTKEQNRKQKAKELGRR